jgi:glycosyltransferase involved in cell wall biosynthesis
VYPVPRRGDGTIAELPGVWQDFSQGDQGIIFCILNASWLGWMANPEILPAGELRMFLNSGQFKKWIYAPIDSEGPNGLLAEREGTILSGFDRVLAYTRFGARLIEGALEQPVEYLPHGLNTLVFQERNRQEARKEFLPKIMDFPGIIADEVFLLGAVATNSPRKDWGLCFEVCGELLGRGQNVGLWAHTDLFQKTGAWDLPTLAKAFGMEQRTLFSNAKLSDDEMAWGYNACDITLSIGAGEGWGYTAAESLACGVPCIHGDYAGSTEFIPSQYLVPPKAFRLDGYYGNRRPVYDPVAWANAIMFKRGTKAELSPEFTWDGCWPEWEQWIREGIAAQ